jgi:inner membrane transporter RhtA
MSSIAPYVTDLLALRRVPVQMFGTFTSINPVWAALAGWVLLHQALDLNEWIGMGLIVISNAVVSARGFTSSKRQGRAAAPRDIED